MKFTFKKEGIENAPKKYVRIRLTEEPKSARRQVRDSGVTWLEIGTGPRTDVTRRKFLLICRTIIREAKKQKCRNIAVQMSESPFPQMDAMTLPELGSRIAENFTMADFEFTMFKTKPKNGWDNVEEVLICGDTPKDMQKGFAQGAIIGDAVNACRILSNTPGGDITPTTLAQAAKDATKGLPVKVTVLGKKEMARLGMGAILGVAKGSTEAPTFTILEYKGGKGAPMVLAGKGVTFDSGGLNLKPTSGIYEMHMDMSGAASVIHAVALAARLKLKRNVVGLIPSVENMPGNQAYRPGDILKSLSGKTIEVLDTDAEGRLILADALTYAKRFKPSVVLDIATLTGAAVSALGLHASALLTRDDALAETLSRDAEVSGDYIWRLPLWDEYEDRVKGEFADIKNVPGGSTSRYGGAIDGGMFLWQFAKELDCPWAHLDIAPRMTSASGDELSPGAAGAPVRLLLRFIEQWTS